jgi:NitT/TauT family transport system substrate-binding protein
MKMPWGGSPERTRLRARSWVGPGLALLGVALLLIACAVGSRTAPADRTTVRVGYFPNLTHATALIGMANGAFQKAVGPDVEVQATAFNAGPSVIEAIFADQLDMSYIGPNPAINGYVKSKGDALRIVAGAASGGAVLIVRPDAGINSPADFEGKRIASPQLGNTQDVALRHWLLANGHQLSETGGKTAVVPTNNPDILTLFQKKEIDAAWVPEPWGARLELEAGGRLFLDERDLWPGGQFATTELIVSRKFLTQHPDIVKNFLAAHVELTQWANQHPEDAKRIANQEIERLTGKPLPPAVLDRAWSRMQVTYDPTQQSLLTAAKWAFDAGFLGDENPDLSRIFDLSILNQVLREKALPVVGEASS